MKILIQWSKSSPQDWKTYDSSEWATLPFKPDATGNNNPPGNNEGWIHALNVQGVIFSGDHYAVEDLPGNRCRVTVWDDDPATHPPGTCIAHVWTFAPLAPDPRLGGALNTRQTRTVYCEPQIVKQVPAHDGAYGPMVRPWSEFPVPPARLVRHGKMCADDLHDAHERIRSTHGWREWGETGVVPVQRDLGRYAKPRHTLSYIATSVIISSVHSGSIDHSLALSATTGASAGITSQNIGSNEQILLCTFTTDVNKPNKEDWPTGDYRAQLDCTATGADIEFGVRDVLGGATGHFARVNQQLDTDLAVAEDPQPLFSGTGLFLASALVTAASWGTASATDRFEVLVAAGRPANHGSQTITLELNETDDFVDGAWSNALSAAPTPTPVDWIIPTAAVVQRISTAPTPVPVDWQVETPTLLKTNPVAPSVVSPQWKVFDATTTQDAGGSPQSAEPTPVPVDWLVETPALLRGAFVAAPDPAQAQFVTPSPAVTQVKKADLIIIPRIQRATPGFANGWAKQSSESRYPHLWRGLVAAWMPSLGNTGGTVQDVSPYRNHGTLTNMDPASDWVIPKKQGLQNALNFAGPSNEQFVAVQPTYSNDINHVTIIARFRAVSVGAFRGLIATRSGGFKGLLLSGAGGNPLTFTWDAASSEFNAATGLTVALNEWAYGAVVIEPEQATIYLGQGGELKTFTLVESNTARKINVAWDIGREPGSASREWDGDISEVRIYARSLHPSEIELDYDITLAPFRLKSHFITIPNLSGFNVRPSPVAAQWAVATPSATVGQQTVAPSPAQEQWNVIAPAQLLLSNTVTPTPAVADWTIATPVISLVLRPPVTTAQWATVTPTLLRPISTAPTPAQADWAIAAPTLLLSRSATPAPAQGQWAIAEPLIRANQFATPAPVAAQWEIETPVLLRPKTTTLTPVPVDWAIPTASAASRNNMQPAPAQTQWAIQAPTLSETANPTPVAAQWNVPTPANVTIGRFLTPDPATVQWEVETGALIATRSTTPDPAQGQFAVVAPTVLNVSLVTPTPVQTQWAVETPATLLSRSVQPTPAQAQYGINAPRISLNLRVSPAIGQWLVTTPTLPNSNAIQPTPAQTQWLVETPALLKSRIATPDPAQTQWQVETATVKASNALTPDATATQWATVTPTVTNQAQNSVAPVPVAVDWLVTTPVILRSAQTVQTDVTTTQWQVFAATVSTSIGATPTPVAVNWEVKAPTLPRSNAVQPQPVPVQWHINNPGLPGQSVSDAQVKAVWAGRNFAPTHIALPPPTVANFSSVSPTVRHLNTIRQTSGVYLGWRVVRGFINSIRVRPKANRFAIRVRPPSVNYVGRDTISPPPISLDISVQSPSVQSTYRVNPPPPVVNWSVIDPSTANLRLATPSVTSMRWEIAFPSIDQRAHPQRILLGLRIVRGGHIYAPRRPRPASLAFRHRPPTVRKKTRFVTPNPATTQYRPNTPSVTIQRAVTPQPAVITLSTPAPSVNSVWAVTPTVTAKLRVLAPLIRQTGDRTAFPGPVPFAATISTPTVIIGGLQVAPPVIPLDWQVETPQVIAGEFKAAPAPIETQWFVAAPENVSIDKILTPSVVVLAAVAETPSVQSVNNLPVAPAAAQWQAQTPSTTITNDVSPDALAVLIAVATPSTTVGQQTVAPAPVAVQYQVETPSVAVGSQGAAPNTIVVQWLAVTPSVTFTDRSVAPDSVQVQWRTRTPVRVGSFVTVFGGPLTVKWGIAAPIIRAPLSVAPEPTVAAWETETPTVTKKTRFVTPDPAATQWQVETLTLVPANFVAPTPANVQWQVETGTAAPGVFTATPLGAPAQWNIVTPTVVVGGGIVPRPNPVQIVVKPAQPAARNDRAKPTSIVVQWVAAAPRARYSIHPAAAIVQWLTQVPNITFGLSIATPTPVRAAWAINAPKRLGINITTTAPPPLQVAWTAIAPTAVNIKAVATPALSLGLQTSTGAVGLGLLTSSFLSISAPTSHTATTLDVGG